VMVQLFLLHLDLLAVLGGSFKSMSCNIFAAYSASKCTVPYRPYYLLCSHSLSLLGGRDFDFEASCEKFYGRQTASIDAGVAVF